MSKQRPQNDSGQFSSSEIDRLVSEVLDRQVGQAEYEAAGMRLAELVKASPAAAERYLDLIEIHAVLGSRFGASAGMLAPMSEEGKGAVALSPFAGSTGEAVHESPSQGPLADLLQTRYWREHRVRFGVLALVLTLLFWVGAGWFMFAQFRGSHNDPSNIENSVARVTNLRGATWAAGAPSHELGDPLQAGDTLDLIGGFVEITFAQGGVVLLEAPANFTVNTRGAGLLGHGRLVARLEKQAERPEGIPFAISTSLAQIIDEGTEFGVEAAQDGTTYVDVFEGRVEVTLQGAARKPQSRPMRLTQGQSARIEQNAGLVRLDVPSRFTREMPEEQAHDLMLTATDWLQIRTQPIGDGQGISVYAVHAPRENYTLLAFDVSRHFGAEAAGPGRMTFTVQGGQGTVDTGSFNLEMRQLNQHNAGVDLATASEVFLDDQAGMAWRNNVGEALPDLKSKNSILDITSSLIASRAGPFAGDSSTTSPAPGTQIVLTIPQATLQSWLDQTTPAIVVVAVGPPQGAPMPRVDFYHFGDGTSQPLPALQFDVVEPKAAD